MSVVEKVKEIVIENVHRPCVDVQPATTFEELNATYLDVVQIVSELEDSYGIEITDEELVKVGSVGDLISCVERKMAVRSPDPFSLERLLNWS
jgi:acyl carrier protein